MKRLKVGVIGLGQVAQIIHLPILAGMQDQFEIAALCDVSPGLLEVMGDRYGVERRYGEVSELVSEPDLDAILVLNSDEYHADHTVLAARSGKHVLVEKPICLTIREANEIIAARNAAGVQVMVAYMRRYAPAFVKAVAETKTLEKINYVRVRDIVGANWLFIDQSTRVQHFDDIPAEVEEERRERAAALVGEAVGATSAPMTTAYRMLLGLGSHDLSAMREMIGTPRRVISASQWNDGRFMTATFEYDGYNAVFEMGVDQLRRFDAHIEIYGESKQIRVQYNTPFMRHLPTVLVVNETIDEAFRTSELRPTFKDPYTHELEHFYDVVTTGRPPKTTPEDSIGDLRLFSEIMTALGGT